MKSFNKLEIIIIGVLVIALGAVYLGSGANKNVSLSGSNASQKCEVNTVTAVSIGNQTSVEVLGIASNRAWARIQTLDSEIQAVTLSFDEGAAATVGNGVQLNSSSTRAIDFGLNTLFPYTGAVTSITSVSSTTVLVTECKFTS